MTRNQNALLAPVRDQPGARTDFALSTRTRGSSFIAQGQWLALWKRGATVSTTRCWEMIWN
jgi:hypothetical protein